MVNKRKFAMRQTYGNKIVKHQRQHKILKVATEKTWITQQRTNLDWYGRNQGKKQTNKHPPQKKQPEEKETIKSVNRK